MRSAFVFGLAGWAGLVTAAAGDEGDDTLRYYLSKSDAVVVCEVLAQPFSGSFEFGVMHYVCELDVKDVMKGDLKPKDSIHADVVRLQKRTEVEDFRISKGNRYLLFLRRKTTGNVPHWETADPWFGVQPESAMMRESLKRLVEEEKQKTARAAQ